MTAKPSQAEGAERSVESEATNIDNIVARLGVNSCVSVWFMVIHPYPKDKKAPSTIGKVFDKLKKSFKHLFIVRELCQSGNPHFHVIGVNGQPPSVMKHVKLWKHECRQEDISRPDVNDYANDPEGTMEKYDADIKQYYINRYYDKMGQVRLMIDYMLKENPKKLYEDFLIK